MNERKAKNIFRMTGALIEDGHFAYSSGQHGAAYINKAMLSAYPRETAALCHGLVEHFIDYDIEAVVAPALGAITFGYKVAELLSEFYAEEVLALYAEKTNDGNFTLKRGYEKLLREKRVLVVEDVLTTGNATRKVVEVVRACGGVVVGVGALWNRGGVSAKDVGGVPELFSIVNMRLPAWPAKDCPLCAKGTPINTEM